MSLPGLREKGQRFFLWWTCVHHPVPVACSPQELSKLLLRTERLSGEPAVSYTAAVGRERRGRGGGLSSPQPNLTKYYFLKEILLAFVVSLLLLSEIGFLYVTT